MNSAGTPHQFHKRTQGSLCRLPYRTPALAAGTLDVQSGSAAPASRDTNHPRCGSIGHRRDGNSRIPCQTTTARDLRRLCEQNLSTSTTHSLRSGSLGRSAELGLALRPIRSSLGHSAATLPCGLETCSLTACPPLAIRRGPVRQVLARSIQPVLADGLTKRAWDTPTRRTCRGSRHGSTPRSSEEVRRVDSVWFDRFPCRPDQPNGTDMPCRLATTLHTSLQHFNSKLPKDAARVPDLRLRRGPFVPEGDDNGSDYDRFGR